MFYPDYYVFILSFPGIIFEFRLFRRRCLYETGDIYKTVRKIPYAW